MDENDELTDVPAMNDAISSALHSASKISGVDFSSWIRSDDPSVSSRAFLLLLEHQNKLRDLSVEEIDELLVRYFEKAIEAATKGESEYTPFTFASELCWLFRQSWPATPKSATSLQQCKSVMESAVLRNDTRLTDAIVLGALEHLFQDFKIAEYFRDWRQRPLLREAFGSAYNLAHGRLDLSE